MVCSLRLMSNLAVAQSFSHEGHDLLLSWG